MKNYILSVRPIYGLLAFFVFIFSVFVFSAVPVRAEGECEESIGQTCTSPPYRIVDPHIPGQPKAMEADLWPDEPRDEVSDGCSIFFVVDQSKKQLGVGLYGTCNDTTDVQAQEDCAAYVDYWARSRDDYKPHWWISRAAMHCPWSDGSNDLAMLRAVRQSQLPPPDK